MPGGKAVVVYHMKGGRAAFQAPEDQIGASGPSPETAARWRAPSRGRRGWPAHRSRGTHGIWGR